MNRADVRDIIIVSSCSLILLWVFFSINAGYDELYRLCAKINAHPVSNGGTILCFNSNTQKFTHPLDIKE